MVHPGDLRLITYNHFAPTGYGQPTCHFHGNERIMELKSIRSEANPPDCMRYYCCWNPAAAAIALKLLFLVFYLPTISSNREQNKGEEWSCQPTDQQLAGTVGNVLEVSQWENGGKNKTDFDRRKCEAEMKKYYPRVGTESTFTASTIQVMR